MHPRHFRATTFLCLAIMALDVVVAQLPHTHQHLIADSCSNSCDHQHSGCYHSHTAKTTCTHSHACSHSHSHCEQTCPSSPAKSETPAEHDGPCDHCTLCRHHSQAALPCTAAPVSLVCIFCELLPDQRDAQIASVTPLVYRGRGPPSVL